jgi:hypothetical protein
LIPQLSFITYPVKFVMVVVFAAPLLAAYALANFKKIQKGLLPLGGILLALIGGILISTHLAPLLGDQPHDTLLNGLSRVVMLALTGGVFWLLTRPGDSRWGRLAPLLLLLVAWLDVFTHVPAQNPTVPPSVYEANLVRTKLAMQPQPELGGGRAMLSPAAALELTRFAASDPKVNFLAKRVGYCANANLLDAVPKVDGFFSLTPGEFDVLLTTIYSVTNVTFAGLLDFMGVVQTTAPGELLKWQPRSTAHPLVTVGQQPVFADDDNQALSFIAQPGFDGGKLVVLLRSERALVTVTNQTVAKILNSKFGLQSVDTEVDAAAPAFVTFAQTYYHNWQAEVDGQRVPLLRANVAFQAVQVPAGRHQIRLFYRDRLFEVGALVSVFTWLVCLVTLLLPRRRNLSPLAVAKVF